MAISIKQQIATAISSFYILYGNNIDITIDQINDLNTRAESFAAGVKPGLSTRDRIAKACKDFYVEYTGLVFTKEQHDHMTKAAREHADEEIKYRRTVNRALIQGRKEATARGLPLILLMLLFLSCDFLTQAVQPVDFIYHPPVVSQPAQDTCIDSLYLLPMFVTSELEIDQNFNTDLIICMGQYCDTLNWFQMAGLDTVMLHLAALYKPEYTYRVMVYDSMPPVRASIIAEGTNNHHLFLQRTYARYDKLKHYFGWAPQAYIFAGAADTTEWNEIIYTYPSVDRFNFRNMSQWDSTWFVRTALTIEACKVGRAWADFRFNPYPMLDSVLTLYEEAGWNHVLSNFGDGPLPRVVDLRHLRGNVPEWLIMQLLHEGHQVIVRDVLTPDKPQD